MWWEEAGIKRGGRERTNVEEGEKIGRKCEKSRRQQGRRGGRGS